MKRPSKPSDSMRCPASIRIRIGSSRSSQRKSAVRRRIAPTCTPKRTPSSALATHGCRAIQIAPSTSLFARHTGCEADRSGGSARHFAYLFHHRQFVTRLVEDVAAQRGDQDEVFDPVAEATAVEDARLDR